MDKKTRNKFLVALAIFWMVSFLIFAPTANILFSSPKEAKAAGPVEYVLQTIAATIGIVVCYASSFLPKIGISVPVGSTEGTINCGIKLAEKTIYPAMENAITYALQSILHYLLKTITNKIIEYINSDQFGKSGFVLDFNALAKDAGQVAGAAFLNSLSGVNLCSITPRLKLQFAFLPVPKFNTAVACTLDKIVGNINDFYTDFSKGGWVAWEKSLEPNNNAFGTYLMVQGEKMALEYAAINKKEKENTNGFTAKKKCINPSDIDPDSPKCKVSVITTPSGTVETSVNFAALAPQRDGESIMQALYNKSAPYGVYVMAIANALLNRLAKDGLAAIMKSLAPGPNPDPYGTLVQEAISNSTDFAQSQGDQANTNLILSTLKNLDKYITDTAGPLYFNILTTLSSIQTEQDNIITNYWAQGIVNGANINTTFGPDVSTNANGDQITLTTFNITQSQVGEATIQKQEVVYSSSGNKSVVYSLTDKKNQIEDIDGIFTKYNTKYNALIYTQNQAKAAQPPTQNAYDKITAYIATWDGTKGNDQIKADMIKAVSDAIPAIQSVIPSTSTTIGDLSNETVALLNATTNDTDQEKQNQTQTTYNDYLTAVKNISSLLIGKIPTL